MAILDRWTPLCATGLLGLIAGLAWMAAGGAARAEVVEVFAINDVVVDATAETATQARDLAIAAGRETAWQGMLERLALRDDYLRLPVFDGARADEFITGFRVESEKTSAVRYLARLTYLFDPEAVRRELRAADIRFAETASKLVLVLPVFYEGERPILWDDLNPWRDAWSERPTRWGLVPIVLALGDLEDLTAIDAVAAVGGDAGRLVALAQRYGAKAALVVEARVTGDQLDVTARSFGPEGDGVLVTTYSAPVGTVAAAPVSVPEPNEEQTDTAMAEQNGEATTVPISEQKMFAPAVAAVITEIEESWKERNVIGVGSEGRLSASVTFSSLREWREISRRLGRVAPVRKVATVSLSRGRREIALDFVGDIRQLILAMTQSDLILEPASGTGGFGTEPADGYGSPATGPGDGSDDGSDTSDAAGPTFSGPVAGGIPGFFAGAYEDEDWILRMRPAVTGAGVQNDAGTMGGENATPGTTLEAGSEDGAAGDVQGDATGGGPPRGATDQ